MRDLFERLKQEGHNVIEELVASGAQETIQLDREVLGFALSAPANSTDGLLVWGIEAKR